MVSLIGEGFGWAPPFGRLAAALRDRSGGRHVRERRQGRRALLQHALLAHDLFELLFELLLIQQLARGDAVDLRAQFRDAVLIGELHVRLAGDQPLQHVVMKGEIGAGQHRPAGHDHEAGDDEPEGDRSETDLAAAMNQGVVVGRFAARLRMLDRPLRARLLLRGRSLAIGLVTPGIFIGPAVGGLGGIIAIAVRMGSIGHNNSRLTPQAGHAEYGVDFSLVWLIFRK